MDAKTYVKTWQDTKVYIYRTQTFLINAPVVFGSFWRMRSKCLCYLIGQKRTDFDSNWVITISQNYDLSV